MCSPACVRNAYLTGCILRFDKLLKITDLSFFLIYIELPGVVDKSHTRRVVASVLQLFQTLYQDGISISISYVSYYSTHVK